MSNQKRHGIRTEVTYHSIFLINPADATLKRDR